MAATRALGGERSYVPDAPDGPRHASSAEQDRAASGFRLRQGDRRRDTPPSATPLPIELGARVARGATSVIHRARHVRLELDVGVKVLDERFVDDAGVRGRLEREARLLVALRDPGIVRVFDLVHLHDGRPVVVMEWLDGENLEQRIRREGRLSAAGATRIAAGVCAALAYAHARGLLHRDVKPSNVMLVVDGDGERPVLIDFGVARGSAGGAAGAGGAGGADTATGGLLGTPAYMAPEQARDASRVDARADVYSVGAMLFRMLTGEAPYPVDEPWGTLHRLANEAPRSVHELAADIPAPLATLVDRCLARDPALRPGTALELGQALEACASAIGLAETPRRSASRPPLANATMSVLRTRATLAAAALGFAAALVVEAGSFVTHPLRPETRLLLALVGAASVGGAFMYLMNERTRAGAFPETERRIARAVGIGARRAACVFGALSAALALLAAVDLVPVGSGAAAVLAVAIGTFVRALRVTPA